MIFKFTLMACFFIFTCIVFFHLIICQYVLYFICVFQIRIISFAFFKFRFYFFSFIQTHHPKKYNEFLLLYKKKKKSKVAFLPLTQDQFEFSLTQLIVYAMLPLSIVSTDAFKSYTHSKHCLKYFNLFMQLHYYKQCSFLLSFSDNYRIC